MTKRLTHALSTGSASGTPGKLDVVGRVETAPLESALDLVLELTGQIDMTMHTRTNALRSLKSKKSKKIKKNKKNKKKTTFTSENRLGSVGYGLKVASVLKSRKVSTELNMVAEKAGDCSSSGEENSNDSNDSSNDSSNEDDDNFDTFNTSTDSHQHTTTTLRTSTELSYKESRLSHRVAKLQTTAKLMLRMRLSLLSTPIDWNKMRKAIEGKYSKRRRSNLVVIIIVHYTSCNSR